MAIHNNLEHLRTFLTVYRVGSLTEAAKLLGVSQPTASAHVHSLEQNLGMRLFERTTSGVKPTAKADGLARGVGPHIDALDDLASISTLTGTNESIDLGGPAEFLTAMLLPCTPELTEAIGARLRIRFGLVDDLLEGLRTGDLDLVISSIRPRVQGLTGMPLYDEEFLLVGAPSWRSRLQDVAAEAELAAIPVVAYAENMPIVRRYWRSVFERRPDHLQTTVIVPDLRGVRAAIVAGAGMSVLPHYLVRDDLSTGALITLHKPEIAPLNTVYLATRTGELERNSQLRALAASIQRLANS